MNGEVHVLQVRAEGIGRFSVEAREDEPRLAGRGRAVLRMRQVLADHHSCHGFGRFLPRVAMTGDLAAAQYGRVGAELLDLVELVADVQDGATFRRELSQRFEQFAHGLRSENRRRLVHDEQLRIDEQAADDLDALPFADR